MWLALHSSPRLVWETQPSTMKARVTGTAITGSLDWQGAPTLLWSTGSRPDEGRACPKWEQHSKGQGQRACVYDKGRWLSTVQRMYL